MSEHGRNGTYISGCRCEACRTAHAEYQRIYREKRPQAAYLRQWRKDNPERQAEYESRRAPRPYDPEKNRVYARAYYEKNSEKIAAKQREWTRTHPEEAAAYGRARRARERGATGSHTIHDVEKQYLRQAGKCFWCHGKLNGKHHVDHVVPLILGGSNGPENLVISCPSCNQHKQAKHPMDFAGVML